MLGNRATFCSKYVLISEIVKMSLYVSAAPSISCLTLPLNSFSCVGKRLNPFQMSFNALNVWFSAVVRLPAVLAASSETNTFLGNQSLSRIS